MKEFQNISVYVAKGGAKDAALSFSAKTGIPILDVPGDDLTLVFDSFGVSLTGYGLEYSGDFEQMLHRVTDGRLQHEMIAHISKTKKENPKAVDATAGMGEDSLLFAACGYNVTMYERNPVVAVLLKDAMRRARKNPVLCDIVSRMKLIEGDSTELIPKYSPDNDIIYLDPMFPERQKSGLINKKLQLIQKLEQPCCDEEKLLSAAFSASPGKIIIKRPLKGEFLAGKKPDYSINGKAIRYDCFNIHE